MAEFRNIHTRIWKDEWFSELETDAKLLFIFLFSNERASVSGIYELPLKFMAFEVGLDKGRVAEILEGFQKAGKVYYGDGVVWVVNLRKYNETSSDKVQVRLSKDIATIPDCETLKRYCTHYKIPYPYHINTISGEGSRDRDGDSNRDGDGTGDREETPASADEPEPVGDVFEHPEIRLYWEISGHTPSIGEQDRIIKNFRTARKRMKQPPIEQLTAFATTAFTDWCNTPRADGSGRNYSATNPGWTDWLAVGQWPKPAQTAQTLADSFRSA